LFLSKKTIIASLWVGITGALSGWFQGSVEEFPYMVLMSYQITGTISGFIICGLISLGYLWFMRDIHWKRGFIWGVLAGALAGFLTGMIIDIIAVKTFAMVSAIIPGIIVASLIYLIFKPRFVEQPTDKDKLPVKDVCKMNSIMTKTFFIIFIILVIGGLIVFKVAFHTNHTIKIINSSDETLIVVLGQSSAETPINFILNPYESKTVQLKTFHTQEGVSVGASTKSQSFKLIFNQFYHLYDLDKMNWTVRIIPDPNTIQPYYPTKR
jgi:hypothetical protein